MSGGTRERGECILRIDETLPNTHTLQDPFYFLWFCSLGTTEISDVEMKSEEKQ